MGRGHIRILKIVTRSIKYIKIGLILIIQCQHWGDTDKLYISNSETNNLIYGDFSTGNVGIDTNASDYKLVGDLNQRLARVGLMVAPLQLKAIAEELYRKVLHGS